MITKKQAVESQYRQIFHHKNMKNSDNTPVRCRVNGKCKVWKTRKEDFRLPVKYGLYDCFYITPGNQEDWQQS